MRENREHLKAGKSNLNFVEHDVLFFLHIPKTAGLSVISILDSHFSEDEILPLHSAPSPDLWEAYSPEYFSKIRLVRGHFSFGPYDEGIYKHLSQNPICITFLRDPVRRTLSNYNHRLRKPIIQVHPGRIEIISDSTPTDKLDHLPSEQQKKYHDVKNLTLEEFVTDTTLSHGWVNLQTRMIVRASIERAEKIGDLISGESVTDGPASKDDPAFISNEALLALAKERLEQFAFVGLSERFEESIQLLNYTLGWEPANDLPWLNSAPRSSSYDLIPENVLKKIREGTKLDAELYDYAKELFDLRYRAMVTNMLKVDHGYSTRLTRLQAKKNRLGNTVTQMQEENQRLMQEIYSLQTHWGWRGLQKAGRIRRIIIPEGTLREKIYKLIVKGMLKLIMKGPVE